MKILNLAISEGKISFYVAPRQNFYTVILSFLIFIFLSGVPLVWFDFYEGENGFTFLCDLKS